MVATEGAEVAASPEPAAPAKAKAKGGVPIDLQATTDVFLPNLHASLLGGDAGEGDDLPAGADVPAPSGSNLQGDAHATEEITPLSSAQSPSEPEQPEQDKAQRPIDPDSDLLATDIISVSRVRQVISRQKEGQPVSLINPKAMDPESMKQTDLIPRNWRGQLEESGQLPAEMTTTDPRGKSPEVTAAGQEFEPPAEADTHDTTEDTDTDPEGLKAAKGSQGPEGDDTPSEEIEALRKTGSVARAGMSMPFVFDGEGEDLDGIPSGFEDSAPPEDGDVANTGLLSRSFIQRTIQESAEATAPWEGEGEEEQPFVPRGERGEGVPALEEGELHRGIAPPKGSFRKRAAFSHWPSSASGDEDEPVEEELAELGPGSIETGEMKTPPPPAPATDPWSDAAASSTTMTHAHPGGGEAPAQQAAPSRGWMWAALAVLVIGVGAVMGLSMNKAGPDVVEAPIRVGPSGGSSLKVDGAKSGQGAPEKSPAIDISKSAPIPQGEGGDPSQDQGNFGQGGTAANPGAGSPSTTGAADPLAAAPKATPKVAAAPPAPKVGTLKVQVTPPGARVVVDGSGKGTAPRSVQLPAGRHTLRVEKSGYEPWEKQVTIKVGDTEQVKVALTAIPRATPKPTKMRVIITSNVQGAEVFVDGKSVGKTPATAQLREGSRQIKVVAPGKDPNIQNLDIPRTTDPSSFKRVHAQF